MILLRPHHILCMHHFVGKGYSEPFTQNMSKLISHLEQNPSELIMLSLSLDDICAYCPHNKNKLCISQEKVVAYDRKCLALCHLTKDTILSWQTVKQLFRKNILDAGKLQEVCSDCEWQLLCQKQTSYSLLI